MIICPQRSLNNKSRGEKMRPLEYSWESAVNLPVVREYNKNWKLSDLEALIFDAMLRSARDCMERSGDIINICLSGGLDSSLSLAILRWAHPHITIRAFTIGGSHEHEDVLAASVVAKRFGAVHYIYIPNTEEIKRARKDMNRLWYGKQSDGDVGAHLLYKKMAARNVAFVIAHDGIDELMGGYWEHRSQSNEKEKKCVFERLWTKLTNRHLIPLERNAERWDISVILPYLFTPLVEYISAIPLDDRTSREESKIPLCRLAEKYGVPEVALKRKKRGFCDAIALR
jgi:asparagine synthetase B (glutamine-hydrolysing)